MISEDHVTQDWSNDAENTDLITEINYIVTDIHIEKAVLHCINISQFHCIFNQIRFRNVHRCVYRV